MRQCAQVLASLALAFLMAGASASAQERSDSEFPVVVDLVMVDAVVLDAERQPVTGLAVEDFALNEDGEPQEIVSFSQVESPESAEPETLQRPGVLSDTGAEPPVTSSFVIFFDDLNLDQHMAAYAREAVSEILMTHVREGDLVTLVTSTEAASWRARMLAGRAEMLSVVATLGGRRHPRAGRTRRQQAPAVLQHALGAQSATEGRKSLILLSGGFPNDLQRDTEKRLLGAARVSNVAVYFVDARALSKWNAAFDVSVRWEVDPSTRRIYSQRGVSDGELRGYASSGPETLADRTGGFTIKESNDLLGGVRRVFAENRNYYLLGYRSSNPKRDGRFRSIELEVKPEGLNVRSRKGYYAPTGDE